MLCTDPWCLSWEEGVSGSPVPMRALGLAMGAAGWIVGLSFFSGGGGGGDSLLSDCGFTSGFGVMSLPSGPMTRRAGFGPLFDDAPACCRERELLLFPELRDTPWRLRLPPRLPALVLLVDPVLEGLLVPVGMPHDLCRRDEGTRDETASAELLSFSFPPPLRLAASLGCFVVGHHRTCAGLGTADNYAERERDGTWTPNSEPACFRERRNSFCLIAMSSHFDNLWESGELTCTIGSLRSMDRPTAALTWRQR
jgi:hypothetical protein